MNRQLIKKFNKIYLHSIEIDKIMHKRYEEADEEDFKKVRDAAEEITHLTEEIYNDLKSRDIPIQ